MTTTIVHRRYRPRGAARALFECRAPEALLSGPAGTGKTRSCAEKIHHAALKYPGMKAVIIRKTATSLTSTVLATYRKDVAATNLANGDVRWFGGNGSRPPGFFYGNGSTISVAGMDKPTRIMSSEFDLAYVCEAIELTETDWEAITTRLRNGVMPYQQLIADTNPSTPTHWLKQRCDRGTTLLLDTSHTDNPVYFDDQGQITPTGADYLAKLDNLTGVRHARLRKGLWVAADGLIYDDLDPNVHFIDPFPVPAAWPRYWSIDWGFTNPTVIQFWAEDPDGRAYLYREIYMSGRLVEDHAATVLAIVQPGGPGTPWVEPRPTRVICDHDAEDRATFRKHTGLTTTAANKKVKTGIEAVTARLRPAGDGRPRLFLMRGATVERDQALADAHKPTSTMDELPGYVWDLGTGLAPKEQPLKQDDHGADALRYFVADRDLGGTYRIRTVG